MGGGYFQFFTKNRPQNHQKGAILHTSQANGEGSSPPPRPPWLRHCKLPLSSATGIDNISAEHLSFADPCIAVYLSLYFNMCLMHGFIRSNCLETVINPI